LTKKRSIYTSSLKDKNWLCACKKAKDPSEDIVVDERFAQFYAPEQNTVQLLKDGRTAKNLKQGLTACVLGVHSYSSGIHRIRIKIESGNPYLLIRSRNILPVPDMDQCGQYMFSASTYGWGPSNSRFFNGARRLMAEKQIIKHTNTYTITLNCDERHISIINENTNEYDKIEVDVNYAPLPWCLFIALPATKAEVSLLSK